MHMCTYMHTTDCDFIYQKKFCKNHMGLKNIVILKYTLLFKAELKVDLNSI